MKKFLLIGACIALLLMLGIRCFAAEPPAPLDGICSGDYPYITVFQSYDFDNDTWDTYFLAGKQPLTITDVDGEAALFANNGYASAFLNNGEWMGYTEMPASSVTYSSSGSSVQIIATNHDLLDQNGGVYQAKNYDFVPEKPLDIYDNVGTIPDNIGGTLSKLVPIGLAIMAIFVGVALVPRIIHKFF